MTAPPRVWISPTIAGVSLVSPEPVPGRTEYVRADRIATEQASAALTDFIRMIEVGEIFLADLPAELVERMRNTFLTTQGAE